MNTHKVYLAGPITGLSFGESTDWREYINNRFKVEAPQIFGFSPLRGKKYLKEHKQIAPEYDQWPLSTARGITERDKFDCKTSDIVLVNLLGAQSVSIGTVLEIGWASANGIPVVTVMEDDNVHNHAMVRETSSFVVDSLDKGFDVVCAILLPDFEPEHLY